MSAVWPISCGSKWPPRGALTRLEGVPADLIVDELEVMERAWSVVG